MAKSAMDLNQAREKMKEYKLDALIAANEDNIYWTSGKPPKGQPEGDKPTYVVIPADPNQEPGWVVSEYDAQIAKIKDLPIKDSRVYVAWQEIKNVDDIREGTVERIPKPTQHDHEVSQRLLSKLLKDKGLENATIGIEGGFMISHITYSMIQENNPGVKLVNAEKLFWELRSIKTEDEIQAIRASTALAMKGFFGMLSGGIIGHTLLDLHLRFRDTVYRELPVGQTLSLEWRNQNLTAGDPIFSRFNPDHEIQEGETIFWDGGVVLNLYNSDFGRVFSAGKTGLLEKKLYAAMKNGFDAGLEKLKPGNTFSDVWRGMHEGVSKSGYEWFYRGHCGHSLGMGLPGEQPPFVGADDDTVIKPNMVVCLECPLYVVGLGTFHMEDEYLITDDGWELLTPISRELVELY